MNPNGIPHNITLDNCGYTPVYLIQNNGLAQATSYVLTPVTQEQERPLTNNLKLFYENSGNIENSLLINNSQFVTKPVSSPKPIQETPGNKLKLASFLIPKNNVTSIPKDKVTNDAKKKIIQTAANKNIKSIVSTNGNSLKSISFVSSVVNVERDEITKGRLTLRAVPQPNFKPNVSQTKQKIPPKPNTTPQSHTSVQVLKLGETYHGLNNVNEEQLKLVNNTLENMGDPHKAMAPTFDPGTNTRITYKVVSPSDLKVVGKNKIVVSQQVRGVKKVEVAKRSAHAVQESSESENEIVSIPKVTRSGRKVKQPKSNLCQASPKKPKKVTPLTCCQCSAEFLTIYRLQRHYEKYPSHSSSNEHTSLFTCFLTMLRNGTTDEKSSIFVSQLQNFVDKLKALLPCLLKKVDGNEGFSCVINDDLGRLFEMNAGKYNLNIDALDCVKNKDGHCKHNPPKPLPIQQPPPPAPVHTEVSKPTQMWLNQHQDEVKTNEQSVEDCARINPVDNWTVKRIWKRKAASTETISNKKPRLNSEVFEPLIELGNEIQNVLMDTTLPVTSTCTNSFADQNDENNKQEDVSDFNNFINKAKSSHTQFYSAHFDIRSSPIKPSTAIFSKFQIVPEKIPSKSEGKLLRPLVFDSQSDNCVDTSTEHSLDGILKELSSNHDNTNSNSNDLSCKDTDGINVLPFGNPKEWQADDQSHNSFLKPNNLIEPSLIHNNILDNKSYDMPTFSMDDSTSFTGITNANCGSNDNISNDSLSLNQGAVLNFLDSLTSDCLVLPESEMRNNSIDFPLDLFSFNPS